MARPSKVNALAVLAKNQARASAFGSPKRFIGGAGEL
jgi:hypothetical protein